MMQEVPYWGFGGHWRILTWVWHLDIDLDLVTGLCSKFWLSILNLKVQEHPGHLSPEFGALEDDGDS